MTDSSPSNPTPQGEQLIVRLPGQAADWKEVSLWAAFLALLVMIAFFPATGGSPLFRDGSWLQPVGYPGAMSAVWQDRARQPSYQPFAFTVYSLEARLQGKSTNGQPPVMGLHLGALLFHAAAVILLWLILRDLKVRGAWLAAAIFAVHPINAEAVSWITSQDEVIAGALGFGALYCWIWFARFRDRDIADRLDDGPGVDPAITWSLYAGGFILAMLSVLSHPVGIIFPVVAFFALSLRRKLTSSDILVLVIPSLISAILWAVIATKSSLDMATTQLVSTAGLGFWTCLRDLFFPVGMTTFHPVSPNHAFGITTAVVALVGTAAVVFVYWRRSPGLVAGLIGFAIAVAFGLNWFDQGRGGVVSDAANYVASAFLITLVVAGLSQVIPLAKQTSTAGLSVAIVLLVGLMISANVRTKVFKAPVDFWTDVVEKDPSGLGATISQANLADELRQRSRVEFTEDAIDAAKEDARQSIEHAEIAVRLDQHNGRAERTWANSLVEMGQVKEALPHFKNAVDLTRNRPDPSLHLEGAVALMTLGLQREAIRELNESIAIADSSEAHRLLAKASLALNDPKRAAVEARQAFGINPNDWESRQLLAEALTRQGDAAGALAVYQDLVQGGIRQPAILVGAAENLDTMGRFKEESMAYTYAASIDADKAKYKPLIDEANRKERLRASTQPTTGPTSGPTSGPTTGPVATMPTTGVSR